MLPPQKWNGSKEGKSVVYAPPLSEFDMLRTKLAGGEKEALRALEGPSVLIATEGRASMSVKGKTYEISEGSVYFVAQGTKMEV